ncbi:hypothetical protein LG307_14850 [Sutcliffiella horikoshii]|uniref:hypothetical protein n=1 Tax=Sutcliffiella horikoshii TaxID=79883 RepID=UPI00384D34B0
MILLNHLEILLAAIILGAFFALFVKSIYQSKNLKLSLIMTFSGVYALLFPLLIYKNLRKNKTQIIQEVNRDNNLSDEQKKEARKLLSSDRTLLWELLKFSIVKYRQNVEIIAEIKKESYEKINSNNNERNKIVIKNIYKELNKILYKSLTKPFETFISRSIA